MKDSLMFPAKLNRPLRSMNADERSCLNKIKSACICDPSAVNFLFIFLFVFIFTLSFSSCRNKTTLSEEKNKDLFNLFFKERNFSPDTIEEMQAKIKKYSEIVNDKTVTADKLGIQYRMLGLRYIEKEMYNLAIDSFNEALYITPESPALFYYIGICNAKIGKASMDENIKNEMLLLAEKYYLKSIEYSPNFTDALYALAVLYTFELGKPYEAEPLLLKILENEEKNTDAMFLLARIYAESGDKSKAIEYYDRIIKSTNYKVKIQAATDNKKMLLEGTYAR